VDDISSLLSYSPLQQQKKEIKIIELFAVQGHD
jgi:hypothetical protein